MNLLEIPRDKSLEEQTAYAEGVVAGLYAFAWMKDGTYYVGSCGTTLKSAMRQVHEDYKTLTGRELPIIENWLR